MAFAWIPLFDTCRFHWIKHPLVFWRHQMDIVPVNGQDTDPFPHKHRRLAVYIVLLMNKTKRMNTLCVTYLLTLYCCKKLSLGCLFSSPVLKYMGEWGSSLRFLIGDRHSGLEEEWGTVKAADFFVSVNSSTSLRLSTGVSFDMTTLESGIVRMYSFGSSLRLRETSSSTSPINISA